MTIPRVVLSIVLATAAAVAAESQAPTEAGDDLAAALAAARAVEIAPIPAPEEATAVVGTATHDDPKVGTIEITLAELLDELVLRHATGSLPLLVAEALHRLEAARRGIEPTEAAVHAEIRRFLARAKAGSLADLLAARRLPYETFLEGMRRNAAVSAMLAADGVDPADEAAGRRWFERIRARYRVVTDPLALPAGVFAAIHPQGAGTEAPVATVTGADLLRDRIGRLKLVHFDRAFEARAQHRAAEAVLLARGIRWDEARVAARVRAERARYEADFPWSRALETIGRSEPLEIRRFRLDDAVDRALRETDPELLRDDEATLRAYYTANADHFGRATVTASHILIRSADPATGRVDHVAGKARIDEVYEKLRQGARFVDLVEAWSEDQVSRSRGGDVGLFTLVSAYDESFCRHAFALKEGEVSPPVKTRQGWHLIHCRKRTPPDLDTYRFDKVRDIVREDRRAELRRRWIERHVERRLTLRPDLDRTVAPLLAERRGT